MKQTKLIIFGLMVCLGIQAADYEHYSEWMAYSEIKRVPHPYNLDFSPYAPRWSYQVGIELDGMLDVYATYGGDQLGTVLVVISLIFSILANWLGRWMTVVALVFAPIFTQSGLL